MVIRIKRNPKHAEITVPADVVEPSDEVKLTMIAWLVSTFGRKVGVEKIEIVFDPDESDEHG